MNKLFKIRIIIYIMVIVGLTALALGNLQHMWHKEAVSIGIIGGADGPTAIFVTTHVPPVGLILLGSGIVLVMLILIIRLLKRKKINR